ncbi:hypothetical protein GGX14DRAFT_392204 [Mycena pura]|uniref:Uncharacterized protein n=1 Tax=Mycena pura TaxID=153505 RepID=A0AAD6VS96_9AGAR|nr:hypothetical protein GGX14DRAFT_392204 [Mycena pura]
MTTQDIVEELIFESDVRDLALWTVTEPVKASMHTVSRWHCITAPVKYGHDMDFEFSIVPAFTGILAFKFALLNIRDTATASLAVHQANLQGTHAGEEAKDGPSVDRLRSGLFADPQAFVPNSSATSTRIYLALPASAIARYPPRSQSQERPPGLMLLVANHSNSRSSMMAGLTLVLLESLAVRMKIFTAYNLQASYICASCVLKVRIPPLSVSTTHDVRQKQIGPLESPVQPSLPAICPHFAPTPP